ncbi:MAG TPA: ABC transporter permease [Thermoanaerobaculia bacterium]|jgi:predicted permease|nr:ABC transporter permease [Thermoanaerobaculia bacterium]
MEWLQTIRLAARSLVKRPAFSAGAILCLTLAIGAGSSLFLFVYGIMLRPLPVADPARLVWVSSAAVDSDSFGSISYPDLLDLQQEGSPFSGVMAYAGIVVSLRRGEATEPVRGQAVTSDYFAVLGVPPILGRTFVVPAGRSVSAEREVVLSYELWKSHFAADPALVGKPIFLNEEPFVVVGVAPEKFKGTQFLSGSNGLWIPFRALPQVYPAALFEDRSQRWLEAMGRLKPKVSFASAQVFTAELGTRLAAAYPASHKGIRFILYSTHLGHPNQRTPRISMSIGLLATGLLVLLFACSNVTSLLLARTQARIKELGIRVSLGATRTHVVQLLMTETLLLFIAAGALALLVAAWTGRWLAGFQPPGLGPIGIDFSIDWKVIFAIFLLAIVPGIAFGLIPAVQASRAPAMEALRAETASVGGAPRRLFNWRNVLLIGQVAISMVLLIAAGLLLRSLSHTQAVKLGLRNLGVITVPIDLKPLGFEGARADVELRNIVDRFRALQQVRSAALILASPLGGSWDTRGFAVEGHQPPPGRDTFPLDVTAVGPGYFKTIGIQLLQGRDFGREDTEKSPPVAIVNQTMADRFWPGRSAVGQQIRSGSDRVEIVGVVATSKYRRLDEDPRPFVYLPLAQNLSSTATLVLDISGSPAGTAGLIRRELQAINPKLPVARMTTLADAIGTLLLPARLGASLLTACGLLTLALAAVGIYGTVVYWVVSRRQEIGIRMALGAQPGQVLGMVLRQHLAVLWVGSLLGLGLAIGFSILLRGMLYGVGPTDPLTYAEVLLFFCAITVSAGFFPARKAARMSPAVSLKETQA